MPIHDAGQGTCGRLALILGLTRKRAAEGHLPAWRQVAEMLWLRARHGIGPGYYHLGGFWRREIPWRHKTGHLGAREYRRRVAALNPMAYRKLSQHKVAEKAILGLFGVPTPRFLGHLHPRVGRTPDGRPLRGAGDLAALLTAEPAVTRVCFKLVEGWGGLGFRAVEVARGPAGIEVRQLFGDETMPLERFVEGLRAPAGAGDEGWVLEEYFEQHPETRALNPTSVNTLRLWVFRRAGQEPEVLGGFVRIGRAGSLVDNVSSGGMVARVEMATGVLEAAIDGHPTRETYPVHPDHGARIEGRTMPCWAEARALACATLGYFPHMRFAGFDVAIGPAGPVVIELNVLPDIQGAAEIGLALRQVLVP